MLLRKSSSTKGRFRAFTCLILAAGLGGCVDYLKHRDTITLGAGEAQAWNKTVHIADPWPPHARDTQIPGDGKRTAVVIQRYSTGNAEAGAAANAVPSEGAEAARQ
jgi:hypothetical protein